MRNRVQELSYLDVDVLNIDNLESSLKSMTTPETIEGYKCQICKSSKGLEKREVIATLPNVLIIQLKRFEYRIQEQRKVKVNSYFEFPAKLDLKPFTYDEQVDQNMKDNLMH